MKELINQCTEQKSIRRFNKDADVKTISSIEVAEMLGKEHKELLKEIEGRKDGKNVGIIPVLERGNFHLSDYFIESSYQAGNRTYKCYEVTKQGCEILGNKQQGEKGILFTAKYVERFNEMEQTILAANLSPELQMFNSIFQSVAKQELAMKEMSQTIENTNNRIDSIKEVISLDVTSWRDETGKIIRKISNELGGGNAFRDVRMESYDLLNKRMGVSIETRLTNKRRRMADEGVSKSKRDNLSLLDVIAEDKKLIEGYLAIVKEMAIKYGVA